MVLALVRMEPLPEVQVVPEEEALDAWLESRVRTRRYFLYSSLAFLECRHIEETYCHIAVQHTEVEDRSSL